MTQLVTDHTGQLFPRQDSQDPLGHRHSSVVGIPPGGERVRRLIRNDVHLRHGQACLNGQLPHHTIEVGRFFFRDFLRALYMLRTILSLNQ